MCWWENRVTANPDKVQPLTVGNCSSLPGGDPLSTQHLNTHLDPLCWSDKGRRWQGFPGRREDGDMQGHIHSLALHAISCLFFPLWLLLTPSQPEGLILGCLVLSQLFCTNLCSLRIWPIAKPWPLGVSERSLVCGSPGSCVSVIISQLMLVCQRRALCLRDRGSVPGSML